MRREVSPAVTVVILIVVIAILLLAWYLFMGPKKAAEVPALQQTVSPDADTEEDAGGPSIGGGMEAPTEPFGGGASEAPGQEAPSSPEEALAPG